ncbi:MAG TPA: pitrilysin family protein [Gemmatimonadaceae bacterium]
MHLRTLPFALVLLSLGSLPPVTLGAQAMLDRSKPPTVPAAQPLTFPKAQSLKLTNGIPVIVLEDHTSPVVSVVAIVDVPTRLEPAGKTGITSVLGSMLSEGTTSMTADQLADAFADLGNRVSPTGFYTITGNVDRSIALMADQLMHPSFPDTALARVKANEVAALTRAKESPYYLAGMAFRNVVYGQGHPYARSATEPEVESLTRADVADYYQKYYRPPNVTFVVGGDITPAQAVTKLSRAFGSWTAGEKAQMNIAPPKGVSRETIYIVDRPSSPQSVFYVGTLGPPRNAVDYFATDLANTTFGGAFTSRINLNLREQKHYTYGAQSFFSYRRAPEPSTFIVATAVSTPTTDSSLVQIAKELADLRGSRPITAAELSFARANATKGFPLAFETISERADAIAGLISQRLPLDYYNTVVQHYRAVTQAEEEQAAVRYMDPSKMAIVIVGDRKVIEPGIRAANVAPVVVIDDHGDPVP